jgi:putative restriction endonuclease
MKAFIGVTDFNWFSLLSSLTSVEEVNFWQPGGNRLFRALSPGELFLFKLRSPNNFVVGGGTFAHASLLPISLAWDAFGLGNGVRSLEEMRRRTLELRRDGADQRSDFTVGCILLTQPFFLPRERWVPIPDDWSPNIVQGKSYDLSIEPGLGLVRRLDADVVGLLSGEPEAPRYGSPVSIQPRLGQGSFRVLVTDAYERRCVMTGERVLPVLEAAHVRPYAAGGGHRVDNGLLLRSDLHTLLDRGYITVTEDLRLEVSRRIRDDFENGRDYYALHGNALRSPPHSEDRLLVENIGWHNQHVYLG